MMRGILQIQQTAKLALFTESGDESNGEGHPPDSANTVNLALFAESGDEMNRMMGISSRFSKHR